MSLSSAEKARKEAQLKELLAKKEALLLQKKQYQDENKIEFFDKPPNPGPNPPQAKLLQAWGDSRFKIFAFTGGNRSGKTTIGCLITICTAAGEWIWNGERILFPHNKPRKIRIVGQDWEKHIKTVVVPELLKWWPKNRPLKVKKNSLGVESFFIDEMTGSTIEIMSNKQESELHEGWHGDLIYYDEPPRREIRIANARGLVDRRGRELFCMTLLKEAWVDRDVIKAVDEKTGRPDRSVFSVNATIYDNVGFGLDAEGVEQFAKTLNPEEREARLDGKPSYLSGLICKNFDRVKHLVERFKIPSDWPVDISFDIHPRKPQAVLFIATHPYGKRYVCFEIWDNGDGTYIAEEAMRIVSRFNLRVNRVLIDPLSKSDANSDETGNTTFDKINMVLMRHGLVLEVATKDKTSGILEINNHLKGPNNEPSLFFFDDLVITIRQVEGWVYEDKGDNVGKPSKVDDDMPENLYRLLLLDTKYEPPDDDFEEEHEFEAVNSVTGY